MEQEDVYRLGPGGFVLAGGRPLNAWHREFRRAVARLVEALSEGDGPALAQLVPDAGLRRQLPATLVPEPACDARDAGPPERVSVAARAELEPWQLMWERAPAGWRLVRAVPVLQ
jgi:hypothetical protein